MVAQSNYLYMNGSKQFGNVENLFRKPGRNKGKKEDEEDDSLFIVNSTKRRKK